jgi:hypothetical protein
LQTDFGDIFKNGDREPLGDAEENAAAPLDKLY